MDTHHLAGIKVTGARREELLQLAAAAFEGRTRVRMTFLNPDYARRALLAPQLLEDVNGFDVVAVDGNGIRLVTPLFGFRVPERVDTDSFAPHLFRLAAERGAGVYLFGCAPSVAENAAGRLAETFPGLRVVGTEHGFHDVQRGHPGRYADEDSESIVHAINESGAALVVVSLPTPLQQRWVTANGGRLRASFVLTGGSYLDHVSESGALTGSWYPRWADTLRLNWFYRLVRDPRRLWRRYTLESAHFLALVVGARLRGTRGRTRVGSR